MKIPEDLILTGMRTDMVNTYFFEDHKQMSSVCGINDSNIAYLQNLFNCRMHIRGNALEYEADTELSEMILRLIQRLVRLSSLTDIITESEILMEFKALENKINETDTNKENRKFISIGTKAVYPKSRVQEKYIHSMEDNQVTFAVGPAGTGKTFLAVSYSLGELLSGRKQKIILTRPVVEAGESLGFLPGDLAQKLNPYLKPLYDSMEATLSPSTVKRLMDTGSIEIAPLAYMRGRSIHNACVILDEAQNTTSSQMKMFLTRIGENTTAVITGDITQIDLPSNQKSGLIEARRLLKNVEGIEFIDFSARDTVRSRLVQRIIDAYETEKEK